MEDVVLGRIVIYTLPGGELRPAIIVRIDDEKGTVSLQQFSDIEGDQTGAALRWRPFTPYSAEPKPGTWCFAERI